MTVAPGGQDPCDVRIKRGDAAVRELVASRIPMFEFVIRTLIADYDTASIDGRVHALRRIVPVLAGIKDDALRDEYARQAAGWVGWDNPNDVLDQVRKEARKSGGQRPKLKLKTGAGPAGAGGAGAGVGSAGAGGAGAGGADSAGGPNLHVVKGCLLYTSDAADE